MLEGVIDGSMARQQRPTQRDGWAEGLRGKRRLRARNLGASHGIQEQRARV